MMWWVGENFQHGQFLLRQRQLCPLKVQIIRAHIQTFACRIRRSRPGPMRVPHGAEERLAGTLQVAGARTARWRLREGTAARPADPAGPGPERRPLPARRARLGVAAAACCVAEKPIFAPPSAWIAQEEWIQRTVCLRRNAAAGSSRRDCRHGGRSSSHSFSPILSQTFDWL
jgi:hypothetical protein